MPTTKKLWCPHCEEYVEYWGSEETISACPGCSLVERRP
jgi:Zn finger protein HypA/HybF involved in hydrogenase expression